MANNKRLFEDLCLDQAEQQVGGINDGLVTAGWGAMVITVNNNSRRPHKIKIPNSLFLPDLRLFQHLGTGGGRQLSSAKWHMDGKQCNQLYIDLGAGPILQNNSL
jgi:hypothetical protein